MDSIRLYDPQNQRSTDNIDAVTISPAREFVYTREKAFNAIDIIEKDVEICKARKSEKFEQSRGDMLARVGRAVERLKEGIYFDNDYQYLPYIYDDFANITNYIGKSALYIVDEPIRLKEAFHGFEMNLREIYGTLLESDTILAKQSDMFYSGEELFSYLEENGTSSSLSWEGAFWRETSNGPCLCRSDSQIPIREISGSLLTISRNTGKKAIRSYV